MIGHRAPTPMKWRDPKIVGSNPTGPAIELVHIRTLFIVYEQMIWKRHDGSSFARNRLVRKGYRNLSVPNQLYEELERFVIDSKGRYVSVAEVVREAVRELLDKKRAIQKRT